MDTENVINREQILQYLLETQAGLDKYPDYPLREELDELVARFAAEQGVKDLLERAAAKERTLIEKGIIEDEDGDGIGFFGTLLEMLHLSLQGLGRFSWQSLRDRARQLTRKINHVNPVTVAARNALRTLLSMNIFGYATAIMKSAEVKRKVLDLYKRLGGKEENMLRAIQTGSKKRPLLARKGRFEGLDGELGAFNISSLLKQAGSFLSQIKSWIDEIKKREAAERRRREEERKRREAEAKRRWAQALKKAKLSAIRTLLSLNIYGYATMIATHSDLRKKVIDYYVREGGSRSDIERAIQTGARRRGLLHFNRNARVHGVEGLGELGEPVTLATLMSAAGAFLLQIKKWIKEAGINVNIGSKQHTAQQTGTKSGSGQSSQSRPSAASYSQQKKQTPPVAMTRSDVPQPGAMTKTSASVNIGGSSKKTKLLLGLGVAGVTGLGLYYFVYKPKHKPNRHTLKGITLK